MTINVDTPPPVSADWQASTRHGAIVLAVGLGVFLIWSTTARLDSAVLAPGVVAVETNRKTVQHLEGGIVREIFVHDGDRVRKGQVLLRLDPTRVDSQHTLYSDQLLVLLAQQARLLAEREGRTIKIPPEVEKQAAKSIIGHAISDQKQEFSVKRDTLLRSIETVDAQIGQARQDLRQTEIDKRTAEDTLANINTELVEVRDLYNKKLVALPRLSALEREKLRLEGVVANSSAGRLKLQDRIQELTLKRAQVTEDYRQDAATKLVEVRKSINELRQQLIVANDAQHRIDVRAPTEGVVQQMRIFTVGGVLRPGDPSSTLSPSPTVSS